MAHFIFVKMRSAQQPNDMLGRLREICRDLTPKSIADVCENAASEWPAERDTYYAIQNCRGLSGPESGVLTVGWTMGLEHETSGQTCGEHADGSYAIIEANGNRVRFFTDQFGSRTLWFYMDSGMLFISTSQRAVVQLKGCFCPNQASIAWFLSSGCQGPFISWDEQIQQVRPEFTYVLECETWSMLRSRKTGMNLPASGNGDLRSYNANFERYISQAIGKIIRTHGVGEVLLPLSGGLDSRLLLALAHRDGSGDAVSLVNWGIASEKMAFTDKVAAKRVAEFYGKPILDQQLPTQTENLDEMLDLFVEASEGRLDQFNAYTDGFAMWDSFVRSGYRFVLRGDIPFTEGIDIDDASARAHIGLQMFADYDNKDELGLNGFDALQRRFDIARHTDESLIRWRDRLYVEWRIPMVISAFSDIIGRYVENRCPMMSWSLYRQYMALPDRAKGNKKHIAGLWKLRDKSGVPSHAISSLAQPVAYFETPLGREYLCNRLSRLRGGGDFPETMLDAVAAHLDRDQTRRLTQAKGAGFKASIRAWLSDRFPNTLKGQIKAARPRPLEPMVLAYRIVLIDKILCMYRRQAKLAAPRAIEPKFSLSGTPE